MSDKPKKLSTAPYKGVRDFFPEDMAVQRKIFGIWRDAAEKCGYEEYGASVLEPAELYRTKTSEEIVNEQTYTFTDRGDREVTLRPEMTPTLARMVAARRRELTYPLRWYSIPNLFRYEQPQRGRVREHWQLNVDIFGVDSINAEIEVISMASDITRAYGLKDSDFEIRINNRKVMNYVTREVFGLDEVSARKVARLIDKKDKLARDAFEIGVREIFGEGQIIESARREKMQKEADSFLTLLNSKNFEEFTSNLPQTAEEHEGLREIRDVIAGLEKLGITNTRFDQTLMRGFDYYTGIVFEIFDLNPENRRSVFGGGRYDDLLALFGNEKVPAVGFGAGDVIARDLMETYGIISKSENASTEGSAAIVASADLSLCVVGDANAAYALDVAQSLREKGVRVSVDFSGKKLGDQIKNADKKCIPRIIVIGDEEVKTGKLRMKTLKTGEEVEATEDSLPSLIQ